MGCEACDANLRAELSSKDEDELSEEEQRILEGGDPPRYTGPLAPVDVEMCTMTLINAKLLATNTNRGD